MDCRRDLIGFLTDRLTEDLARVWVRDAAFTDRQRRRRPGVAAQVAVLDDLLDVLGRGHLPASHELRMVLFGYSAHPDFDPRWHDVLQVSTPPPRR